ncbi:MAG: glycosyltransferase family 8 protein [Cypionkella sp.]
MDGIAIAAQSRIARKDRAVYFCVDAKFYPFALFVADQIATKYPQREFDLCLISAEPLPNHPLMQQHDIRVIQIDAQVWGSRLPADERISFAAYLRIMAPDLLSADYRRMLYLDADVFYQRGDLNRLLDLDLGGRAVGAVRDMVQLRKPDRVPEDFRPFNLPFGKYFNSGVLLIDVAAWTAQQVTKNALDFAANNALKLMAHDQTALNVTLRDNWAELSLVWNYEYSHQTMYFMAFFDVCFVHFIGRRKPFNGSYGGFPRRFTEEYRRFFATHMQGKNLSAQDGLQVADQRRKHIYAILFHLVNFGRFLPNDDRFMSEWDVIL